MTNKTFSDKAKNELLNKTIVEVKSNYIKLSNGLMIYISEEEIEFLNEYEDYKGSKNLTFEWTEEELKVIKRWNELHSNNK